MSDTVLCEIDEGIATLTLNRPDIISAVTRGLNMTIAEGLVAEGEQFARMVATNDIHEGLDAWIERRVPAYSGT